MTNETIPPISIPMEFEHTDEHPECLDPTCPCHQAEAERREWEGDTGEMARIEREEHKPALKARSSMPLTRQYQPTASRVSGWLVPLLP